MQRLWTQGCVVTLLTLYLDQMVKVAQNQFGMMMTGVASVQWMISTRPSISDLNVQYKSNNDAFVSLF